MDYEIMMNGNVKIGSLILLKFFSIDKLSNFIFKGHRKNLNDKEKIICSMILYLSKENAYTMSNTYISKLLNICNVQASRIINSLKKKEYVKIEIVYKQNSKEIALRKIIPINKYVNTSKRISNELINKNVKDIINKDKIYNKNYRLKNDRDYSNFDWTSLYANIF